MQHHCMLFVLEVMKKITLSLRWTGSKMNELRKGVDFFITKIEWTVSMFWDKRFSLTQMIGILRNDDFKANDNAKNQIFDWLNEKQSCCTCGTLFDAIFWRSLPNDDEEFSYFRLWRERKPAAVNLSFFDLTWRPFAPSNQNCTLPILYNLQYGITAKPYK